jgi:hypothetical protein
VLCDTHSDILGKLLYFDVLATGACPVTDGSGLERLSKSVGDGHCVTASIPIIDKDANAAREFLTQNNITYLNFIDTSQHS